MFICNYTFLLYFLDVKQCIFFCWIVFESQIAPQDFQTLWWNRQNIQSGSSKDDKKEGIAQKEKVSSFALEKLDTISAPKPLQVCKKNKYTTIKVREKQCSFAFFFMFSWAVFFLLPFRLSSNLDCTAVKLLVGRIISLYTRPTKVAKTVSKL